MREVKGRHDEGSHPASVCDTKREVAGQGSVAWTQGMGACLPCILILIRMKGWVRQSRGGLSPRCVKGGREGCVLGVPVPCTTKGDGALARRGGCRLAREEGQRCSWVEGTRAHCPTCSSVCTTGRAGGEAGWGGGTLFPLCPGLHEGRERGEAAHDDGSSEEGWPCCRGVVSGLGGSEVMGLGVLTLDVRPRAGTGEGGERMGKRRS
jgi:hypothetical protein